MKSHFFTVICVLGLFIGIVVALVPTMNKYFIQSTGKAEVQITHEKMKQNLKKKTSFNSDNISPMTTQDLLKQQFSEKDMPGIGIISIPDISLELPVFNGITYETMMYGASTAKPNQVMGQGNYSLASHTIFNVYNGAVMTDLLFGNLIYAQPGQKIYLTDKDKVYEYKIDNIFKVNVSQGNIIENHDKQKEITLYTCTSLAGNERLVVHGNLEKRTSYKESVTYF